MSKFIEIDCDGVNHTLQFNRFAIKKIEALGFSTQDLGGKLVTNIELLFFGSLIKSNPRITQKEANVILDTVLEDYDTTDLFDVLIDLFTDAVPVIGNDLSEEEMGKKKKLIVQHG